MEKVSSFKNGKDEISMNFLFLINNRFHLQCKTCCLTYNDESQLLRITNHLNLLVMGTYGDMNQEIRIESNEEVEEVSCLEVEELFEQLKSHKIKCLRNYVFMFFHLFW